MNNMESEDRSRIPAARRSDRTAPEGVRSRPKGTPRWVTAELIERTIRVWQPYCAKRLSVDDALEMISNAAALADVLPEKPKNPEA